MFKFQKPSNAEHVAAFFTELRQAAPNATHEVRWLDQLERRARGQRSGWVSEAESFLQGLAAAGALSDEAVAACRKRLAQSIGSREQGIDLFAQLGWLVLVTVIVLYGWTLAPSTHTLVALVLLAAAAGGLWAATRPWLDQRNNPTQSRWTRLLSIGLIAVGVPFIAALVTLFISWVMLEVSIGQFRTEREAFLADPQGFPMLRKLAREHYGIEVVLGDANTSWGATTVRLPGSSVALMNLGPGYCLLSFHREHVLRRFTPPEQVASALWVQGVMLHEFAHCLDASRDMPASGLRAVGARSVAPADAVGLQDLEGWLEASGSLATQLWREAAADTMAVGFWRLSAPDAAQALTASLRQYRADAKDDTSHATMCWIDFAAQVAPPSSMAALFSWADQLRSQAPCALPKRQAQAAVHAVQAPLQR